MIKNWQSKILNQKVPASILKQMVVVGKAARILSIMRAEEDKLKGSPKKATVSSKKHDEVSTHV